jgi:hypothetical protein
MRCLECRAEFDEMNESQPVCPGCGAAPGGRRDSDEICALLDEAAVIASAPVDRAADQDPGLDIEQPFDPIRMPADLQEAGDDAEALLEATGYAAFVLLDGFRLFPLPTDRVM